MTRWPLFTRFTAAPMPMVPSPITPTFICVLLRVLPPLAAGSRVQLGNNVIMRRDTRSLFSVACWSLKWEGISGAGHYRPWRKRSTAATSARRMPGSSAECPASGTIDSRAAGQAAASSNAVAAGQIMS